MKDPKALFPVLFISSWLGDLVLTVLAFFLAFTQADPLTPLLFLTIAFCILAGNLLPIGTYWLYIRWHRALLEAESAEASLRVRESLERAEAVMNRLDEAEGSLSKGILVARQVPERIEEKFRDLEGLAGQLGTLPLEQLASSFSGQANLAGELGKRLEAMQASFSILEQNLRELPEAISRDLRQILEVDTGDADGDVPVAERLDLLHESMESLQESLDELMAGILKKTLAAREILDDGDIRDTTAREKDKDSPSEPVDVVAPQAEMALEEADADPEPTDPAEGQTRVIAQAMIGMQNALFLRGDGPLLSWDQGVRMDLIGIGEFAWSTDSLKHPMEAALYLNDDLPSGEGPFVIHPGKILRLHPHFPKDS